jgi:hypothetical protein
LFELVIEPFDLRFGLLEPGSFDDVPTAVSLCYGKLVCTYHVQDFHSSARRKRVRAQHRQALVGDSLVETFFVFAEMFPILLLQPSGIPGHSHAGVTSGRCTSEFFQPTGCHSLEIERAAREIPIASGDDFYTGAREVPAKARHRLFQRICRFFDRQGVGDNPKAELPAFQAGLAVWDQGVEEVLFRLVEETKVSAPRHVANDIDSGLPRFG